MNKTVTIAPVCKSVRVKASQAHAFEVFTAGLDRWWPRKGTIGTSPLKTVTIEPRLGGRWYETGEDGSEATVGKISPLGSAEPLHRQLGHQPPLEARHDCGLGG